MNNQLKYTIKSYLDKWHTTLPYPDYITKRDGLITAMGISASHFRNVINYQADDANEIRASQLKAAADYIEIPMEELFTKVEVSASSEG